MRGIGRRATDEERERIFQAGNLVPSYGGDVDRVIEYHKSAGGWAVTVIGTEPNAFGQGPHVRQHCTEPSIARRRLPEHLVMMVDGLPVLRR
jgi:hypothetical protein